MPTRALTFVQQCCGVSLAGAATSPPPCPREAPLVLTSTTWPQLLSSVLGTSLPAPSPALWTFTTPYLCYPLILAWLRLTGIIHLPIRCVCLLETMYVYIKSAMIFRIWHHSAFSCVVVSSCLYIY